MHKYNRRARRFVAVKTTLFVSCAAISISIVIAGQAQQPFFIGLSTSDNVHSRAYGVSADGNVVLGSGAGTNMFLWTQQTGMVDTSAPTSLQTPVLSRSGTSIFAYRDPDRATWRWTAETGWAQLSNVDSSRFLFRKRPPDGEPSTQHGVSADGSQVVGDYCNLTTHECPGARWTATSGVQTLNMIPLGGMSADGSVVVGRTSLASGLFHARRWTAPSGVTSLGLDAYPSSQATSVSFDGSVIAGQVGLGNCCPARANSVFLWREQSGPQVLSSPIGATEIFTPIISDDGSTLVAAFSVGGVQRTFRWRDDLGWQDLNFNFFGGAISDDGSIIMGRNNNEAIIWDEIQGARPLKDVLVDLGLAGSLAGWGPLYYSAGVSADGRTIVGGGVNPQGYDEAWIAYLGPRDVPLSGDFNNSGAVDAADYVVWRKGFIAGTYTQDDYNAWRANFGATAAGAAAVAQPQPRSAVPEPSALALTLLAVALLAIPRRSSR